MREGDGPAWPRTCSEEDVVSGYFARNDDQLEPLHRRLADFNRLRLSPRLETSDWRGSLRAEMELRVGEGQFVETERQQVSAAARAAPDQPRDFIDWFDSLRERSAEQSYGFYQWLAEAASRDDLSWVLAQEVASGEPPEDLFALTQLGLPWRAKLEIARCYWDEMGQGQATAMRSRVIEGVARELHVDATHPPAWEALARGNLMFALAGNRHYGFQSVGALGALELSSAGPAKFMSIALKRLGFSIEAVAYFTSRGKLGVLRSHAWTYDVILPLIAQDARIAIAVAEGALMRLAAEARCLDRYQRELRGAPPTPLARPTLSARSGERRS